VLFLFSVPLAVFCSLCSLDSLTVSLRPFSSLSTGFDPLFFSSVFVHLSFSVFVCSEGGMVQPETRLVFVCYLANASLRFTFSSPVFHALSTLYFLVFLPPSSFLPLLSSALFFHPCSSSFFLFPPFLGLPFF